MAYGIEYILGWTLKELDPRLNDVYDEYNDIHAGDIWRHKLGQTLSQSDVKKAQEATILRFMASKITGGASVSRYSVAHLHNGKTHEFHPMSIEYFEYDEADDEPEDVIVGVKMTSRYAPVLIDIPDHPHGGVDTMKITDWEPIVDFLRAELAKTDPIWKEAKLFVKFLHY